MNKKTGRNWLMATGILLSVFVALTCYAAYPHQGEIDSVNFVSVYPQAKGTKLDSCTTCHSGGSVTSGGKTTTYGNCQWCHYKTNYGADTTQYVNTLNSYGLDYYNHGRGAAAITAIQDFDSDGDHYSNKVEIAALRYPGDTSDNPTKVAAPFKVFTRAQLEAMPQHAQFLMMNASKSTDFYGTYTGVTMESLVQRFSPRTVSRSFTPSSLVRTPASIMFTACTRLKPFTITSRRTLQQTHQPAGLITPLRRRWGDRTTTRSLTAPD